MYWTLVPTHNRKEKQNLPNYKADEMAGKSADSRFAGSHDAKQRLSRQRRHRLNRVLRELPLDEDSWLDCEEELEHDSHHRLHMYWLRGDRRSNVNLSPLFRWADDKTRDMAPEDRAAYVVSRLPQGKRGWPARDAVYHHLSYDARSHGYDPTMWRRERKLHSLLRFLEVVELLERVIVECRLKAFNAVIFGNGAPSQYNWERTNTTWGLMMIKTKIVGDAPRTLRDKADIVPFLEFVLGRNTGQLERERMLAYLKQVYGYEPS